jgi:DNA modification methylase
MDLETNVIYCGDCLKKLKDIPDESVDLIYIDPPFSSNRNYVAFWEEQERRHFEDRFENVQAYLEYMKPRLIELYRVLKQTGSFYYHCDWHASHYIKVLLDSDLLFGYSNFKNEIVWRRSQTRSSISKIFKRSHDIILLYAKSSDYRFQMQYKDLSDASKKLYEKFDDKGYYQLVPLIVSGTRNGETGQIWKGIDPNKCGQSGSHWVTKPSNLDEYERQGLVVWPAKIGGLPRLKYYLGDNKGVPLTDLWDDIDLIQSSSDEALGYPTQKPIALLKRIIDTSSLEGEIVLDAFCGCGTALEEAQSAKRKWIGIDISPTACRVVAKRLEDNLGIKEGEDFTIKGLPMTVNELREYPAFEFQNWVINALGGVPNKIRVRDMGIDGKLYPIEDFKKEKKQGLDLFGEIDRYIPIQVKRTDQIGRPEIDSFETAMKRDKRDKGIVIGFDFSKDALKEIRRIEREEGILIEPKIVSQIVEDQLDKSLL